MSNSSDATTFFDKQPLFQRLTRGTLAHLFGNALQLLSRFILVPLFLSAWGIESYGVWLYLTAIVTWFNLLEGGLQRQLLNSITHSYVDNNIKLTQALAHTGLVSFTLIATFLALCSIVWALLADLSLFQTVLDPTTLGLLIVVLVSQIGLALVHGYLAGLYRSFGMVTRGTMLTNAVHAFQLASVAFALTLHVGMLEVALVHALPLLFGTLVMAKDLPLQLGTPSLVGFSHARWRLFVISIKPSLQFFAIRLSSLTSAHGLLAIVGTILTPLELVVFATSRTLVNLQRQLNGATIHSAYPDFTRLYTQSRKEQFFKLRQRIQLSVLAMALTYCVVLAMLGEFIFKLWLGARVDYDPTLMLLLLIHAPITLLLTFRVQLLMACNLQRSLTWIAPLQTVATLVGVVWAGNVWGIYGVAGILVVIDAIFLPIVQWITPYSRINS